MDRVIVAFSGLGTRFIESIRKQLQSQHGIVIAIVDGKPGSHEKFIEGLSLRVIDLIERYESRGDSISALFVTASSGKYLEFELDHLCPAMRFITVEPLIQLSPRLARELVSKVHAQVTGWKASGLRKMMRPSHDALALLPLRNCGIREISGWLLRMCRFEEPELPRSILKKISRQPNGEGVLIRNIKFKGETNGEGHPVRRCTDSAVCDLKARLRVGHAIPARFEFDVSSRSGLDKKRFYWCDGSRATVPASATHLNMRINDDFKF